MKQRAIYDFAIIGQGLAGSILALQLRQLGQDVFVFDNQHHLSSSIVASGLLNPVTGQRLHADDNVHTLLSHAYATYRSIEKQFSISLLHPLPMRRYARSNLDKERWQKRCLQSLYRELIGEWRDDSQDTLGGQQGHFEQYQCARLDIAALLSAVKNEFARHQRYLSQSIRYSDIHLERGKIRVQDRIFKRLVFCQGAQALDNPWFAHDMWNLSRGDILHFKCNQPHSFIANYGFNYIPVNNNEFHWGASFDTDYRQVVPTKTGYELLLRGLKTFDPETANYRLLAQYSGIRPASRDKKPLIGIHPLHPNLAIFNGFGARGSLLIPFHAQNFVAALLDRADIHAQVNYRRFQINHRSNEQCDSPN